MSSEVEKRRDRSRDRDRDRDRDRGRDRSRDRDRDRRDRDSRRDRDVDPGRDRRDRDYRDRDRDRDRDSRRDRDRDGRSPGRDNSRRERDRSYDRSNSNRREPPREKSPEVNREEQRKQREIDDLTKDQRTIFVSQLTKKTTEKNLENFFGQIGKVKNIIMLRDKATGMHKGFAYVEMDDLDTIPNCLLFNNVVPDFQKYAILVKASEAEKNFLAKKDPFSSTYQPEPGQNPAPGADAAGEDARIYIGNIHISVDENGLRSVLEQFGPTDTVKLHRDHLGNSKGFAFIKFVRAESAKLAMTTLPGQELVGRPLKVGPVIDHKLASTMANFTSIDDSLQGASGNWKLDADDAGSGMILNSSSRVMLMAKLGEKAGIEVPLPPQMNQMAPIIPAIIPTNATPSIPMITGAPTVNLLVRNMFDPATETEPEWDLDIKEDMLEECSKFGQVEHVHVEKYKPGGIVVLKFRTMDAANRAAMSLNGRFFAGRMITVTFIDEITFNQLTIM